MTARIIDGKAAAAALRAKVGAEVPNSAPRPVVRPASR